MIKDIMDVPFPLADSSLLINFFTFHISMFFSASPDCGSLMFAMVRRRAAPGFGVVRVTVFEYASWDGVVNDEAVQKRKGDR